jgi:ubiquinone/menaquinone biosynthesis C-methylase UbiE
MKDKELYKVISTTLDRAENILDIGCGEGVLCNYLANKMKKKITGLDISEDGFKKAKRTATLIKTSGLVRCINGDAHSMPYFESGEFDAITMVYTLHHISQPEIALQEIKRVLRPNGKIVTADYIIQKGVAMTDCHKFNFLNIKELFQRAGFKLSVKRIFEPDLAFLVAVK